jgi:single-strand DNA-binding protein
MSNATPAHAATDDDRPWSRNDVHLVGTLTSAPERRALPSGDELLVLTVTVGRPDVATVDALPVRFGPAPPPGRRPSPEQCGRRRLAAVERLEVGTTVEVRGALRRRWWRAPTGAVSRVEVAATSIDAVTLADAGAGAAPAAPG